MQHVVKLYSHNALLELTHLKLSDELLYDQRDTEPPVVKRATLVVLDITLRLAPHLVRISSAQTSNSMNRRRSLHLNDSVG